mmetsp:Transcript_4950/g.12422  ORF Transcript_4950/g.12422 Transcript_4950/m.12422 type:complete len:215 (-) Transcript_4950:2251-2895(-)
MLRGITTVPGGSATAMGSLQPAWTPAKAGTPAAMLARTGNDGCDRAWAPRPIRMLADGAIGSTRLLASLLRPGRLPLLPRSTKVRAALSIDCVHVGEVRERPSFCTRPLSKSSSTLLLPSRTSALRASMTKSDRDRCRPRPPTSPPCAFTAVTMKLDWIPRAPPCRLGAASPGEVKADRFAYDGVRMRSLPSFGCRCDEKLLSPAEEAPATLPL